MANADFFKTMLSASTDGRGIAVSATISTPASTTLLHTAFTNASLMDLIDIYVNNIHSADVTLYLQFGGPLSADLKKLTISAAAGDQLVVAGLPLRNGLDVRAYASSANAINAWGSVNRAAS